MGIFSTLFRDYQNASTSVFQGGVSYAGFLYDQNQDIFYSPIDCWQRQYGYCRLYDEALAPLGMIADCEPIYFVYDQHIWLIEFWKGQYGMTAGGEIGIYRANEPATNHPDIYRNWFYECISDDQLMDMSMELRKSGEVLIKRQARHWWLNGFRLGEFSETSELTLSFSITFPNIDMCRAFAKALLSVGYTSQEYILTGRCIHIVYGKPYTQQPSARSTGIERISQARSRELCRQYQNLLQKYQSTPEKLAVLQKRNPALFEQTRAIGRSRQAYAGYSAYATR